MKKILSDYIYTIDNFFTPEECQHFIKQSEALGYHEAMVNINGKQVIRKGIRNNDRVLHKDYELERQLWNKLEPFVPTNYGASTAIGLNEMFRYYRYVPGQRFKSHLDGSHVRNEKEMSFFTFMVYLNDDFEGGATKFHDLIITPKQGKAVIFLHKLRHEGMVLNQGTKYILRTDIMYRLS